MAKFKLPTNMKSASQAVRLGLIKMDDEHEVLGMRTYTKAGYVVYYIRLALGGLEHPERSMDMATAYTPTGEYIGDTKFAHRLYARWGIKPQLIAPDHNVCSIGWSSVEGKWYGWSHRAIYGFKVGDVVAKGDITVGPDAEWLAEHPEDDPSGLPVGFVAKTVEDAKTMAVAFANGVA